MNPAPSPPLPPRSAARIFRKAAEEIANDIFVFSCNALDGCGTNTELRFYKWIFQSSDYCFLSRQTMHQIKAMKHQPIPRILFTALRCTNEQNHATV